jgi:elongation factor P
MATTNDLKNGMTLNLDGNLMNVVEFDADAVGGAASWLTDGATPYVTFYEGTAIGVELPAAVELQVAETEPGVKGDRVSGATKPATVETGAVVQVPLFVETGDRIKVDTRSGAYLTRVQ